MPLLLSIMLVSMSFAGEIREAKNAPELESIADSLKDKNYSGESGSFTNVTSGSVVPCASHEMKEGYEESKLVDCTGDGKTYPGGFRFRSREGHPLINRSSPYGPGAKPQRIINFWSRNHALNETFLYLNDEAGGPDSHDTKSAVIVLPRKVIPDVRTTGDDVEVTMNTGEKVVFDKRTGAIKSGVLKEGPNDLTTDRFRRLPPNVEYIGTGVSIRLNHRFEDPFQSAESAEVRQGERRCRVARTTLFDGSGKLRTSSDAELLRVLNLACPGGKPFRI